LLKTPLNTLVRDYEYIFCDVWGVIHNGIKVWAEAEHALIKARNAGKYVILLTNSPRRNIGVAQQLSELGLSDQAYDKIVTSGDVTRTLIKQHPNSVFHLGPERDVPLFDGLGVSFADEQSAETVVCTGLFDDKNEGLEAYQAMMEGFAARNVTFICANPDLVVHHGGKMLYCAGSLAKLFEEHGGKPLVAGKPHQPIYDHAFRKASIRAGDQELKKSQILAIGDALPTDVKGACDYGLDVLFISGGIHREEFGNLQSPDPKLMQAFLTKYGYEAKGYLPQLSW
jgi:HAD superfamily hydrolase (TIGR01459 family)